MGEVDTERQALNVARMRMLGATVVPVTTGSRTLKDAINEAMRDWVANVDHTHYLLGTAAGPHPFPAMVRDFVRGIGVEARQQCLDADRPAARRGRRLRRRRLQRDRHLPRLRPGRRRAALRLRGRRRRASTPAGTRRASPAARSGVLHGARTYLLQDEDGQTVESHSISAGLDYPGVGPGARLAADTGRARYEPVTDAEAMEAFRLLVPHRGDHPGDRERARARRRAADHPGADRRAGPRADGRGQPVRPGRQGRATPPARYFGLLDGEPTVSDGGQLAGDR